MFRRARVGTDYEWATPHTFRKTVASVLGGSGASARMIADQLGHARISMTKDVVTGRQAVSPALTAALERFDEDQRPRPRDSEGRWAPVSCHLDLGRAEGLLQAAELRKR